MTATVRKLLPPVTQIHWCHCQTGLKFRRVWGAPMILFSSLPQRNQRSRSPRRKLLQSAAPGALVWITYPKKTSGVDSDLCREAVWVAMEGTGWGPVSQVAIDEV